MSEHGAVIQSYNQELVKNIERLKMQKEKLSVVIEQEEEEKLKILENIERLNQRLITINASLEEKIQMREECNKTLADAETGLNKIIESSQIILSLVKQKSSNLSFL